MRVITQLVEVSSGAKPKDYPSSIENLARRALKGEPLRSINPLVDLYNVVSLELLDRQRPEVVFEAR